MRRKEKEQVNFLELIPVRNPQYPWREEKEEIVLEIENKGVFHTLAQKLLKKPRISQVHLDEMGSFIWPLLDGERTVKEIADLIDKEFGQKAAPLYPRIVKYFQILDSYGFVKLDKR